MATLLEFLRNSALDARSFFAQTPFTPPFRQNQFGGALGGPLKKNRLFLFGDYEGFRQAETLSSVSVVPDAQVRLGTFPNSSGVYVPVANLSQAMLPYFSFWPQPNGPELLVNGTAQRHGVSPTTIPSRHIREDFGTMRLDYQLSRPRFAFRRLHHRQRRQPDPAGRPAVRLLHHARACRWPASRKRTSSRRDMLNTARAGFSRAGFNLDSTPLGAVPVRALDFVSGRRAGRDRGQWRRHHHRPFRHHFGRPQQRRRRAGTAAICSPMRTMCRSPRASTRSAPACGCSGSRTMRIPPRASLGQATFTSLTTFLQGTVSTFQVVPNANELGWRSLFGAWYVQDAIKLRRNLTVRPAFATSSPPVGMRNMAAPPITSPIPPACSKPRPSWATSAFTEEPRNPAVRRAGPAWRGTLRQRKDGRARGFRHLLFADRRP